MGRARHQRQCRRASTFIETPGTAAALADPAFKADTLARIAALPHAYPVTCPTLHATFAQAFLAGRAGLVSAPRNEIARACAGPGRGL
jgi:hypothetical protein